MKKRLISTALALCLCVSATPGTYALQETLQTQETPAEEQSTAETVPYDTQSIPTYQQVYDALIAMREKYPDNMIWTDDTPYSDSNLYTWEGGPLDGKNIVATGCVAFAFELSDEAFGKLPARMFSTGQFSFSDVKVGDILRVNNDAHTVIVLRVTTAGVEIAEGNNGGRVQWGRTLSAEAVEAASHYITRYPENYINPDDPSANDVIAQGPAGALTWTLTKAGTLTISGSGAMPDYSGPSDLPWKDNADKIASIVIENGVTTIGNSAFYNSSALSVTIPSSVTAIGGSAFYGASLISVSLPSSVKTIGSSAFRLCPNLTSVSLAEGVETIGDNAFRGCQKLTAITLPASVGEVGAGAFFDCVELERAVFAPSSKQVTLGDDLFARCWKLNMVTLPQSLSGISPGMFQNCYVALVQLNIPQGTASIGASAFASCSVLSAITIPDSVTVIGSSAFSACSALKDVYFGGSEEQWNRIEKPLGVLADSVTIHYNSTGPGTDPGPGPGTDPGTDPTPSHTHSWAAAWSSSATHHWHNCTASGCTVTDNSLKDGYAPHVYDNSMDPTCNVCGYTRTINNSSSSGSSSSGEDSSSTSTTTTKNPDGSTTTKTENKTTGVITETTRHPDGSQTVVVTKRDGTITTTTTAPSGVKTETVDRPDGSSVTNLTQPDGTTAAIQTSASGQVAAEAVLSAAAVREAQRSGGIIPLPIPEVRAPRNPASAPAITVKTGSAEPVTVEIPLTAVNSGVVAVMVRTDGREEIVKASVPTENGIAVPLPNGATVKIVDNSKTFSDVTVSHWASNAIQFTTARELFSGTSAIAFAPEAPMTRAMLMTVLARYAGEDTSGGAVWYEKGMDWAVAHAISDGSDPDGNLTREQLAAMLWRYSGSPAVSGTLDAFTDAEEVSGYAQEAVRWAVEKGILSGFGGGRLGSREQATRAQVAAILMRYIINADA